MMHTYQEKLNEINQQMKQWKAKKNKLLKEIEQAGFMVEKEIVKENTGVIGLFWNLTYYSTYVSEKGALYDRGEGAVSITKEEFDTLKVLFQEPEENEEAILEFLLPKMNVEDYFLEESMHRGFVKITDDCITWEVLEEARYQGDIDKGSIMEIRNSSTAEISKTKNSTTEDTW